jgi:hypothetical protein
VGCAATAAAANTPPPTIIAVAMTAEAMSFERLVLRTDIDHPLVCAASAADGDGLAACHASTFAATSKAMES